jgi:endonuclease/exonuclease/phosphatase family metal-dependent hydrolase
MVMKITCLTWNLAGNSMLAQQILTSPLLIHELEHVDLLIVSFQEYIPLTLYNLLSNSTHGSYGQIFSKQLGGLVLLVFSSKPEMFQITHSITLADTWLKNKGSIVITINNKYGVIASHLDAHSYEKRNHSYHKIMQTCSWLKNLDWVIWMGDLNYRLLHTTTSRKLQDELRYMQKHKLAFDVFSESAVKFPLTYKYDIHSNQIPNLKKRGWCDRILWWVNKKNAAFKTLGYSSLSQYTGSDHKPVLAKFEVLLK